MNEIQPYQNSIALVVDRVLDGLQTVSVDQSVDEALDRAYVLVKFADQVKEGVYGFAEQQQSAVMRERAVEFEEASKVVRKASKNGDIEAYDEALQQAIHAGVTAKESAVKMRHIKDRGYIPYDRSKQLGEYLQQLQQSVGQKALPEVTK